MMKSNRTPIAEGDRFFAAQTGVQHCNVGDLGLSCIGRYGSDRSRHRRRCAPSCRSATGCPSSSGSSRGSDQRGINDGTALHGQALVVSTALGSVKIATDRSCFSRRCRKRRMVLCPTSRLRRRPGRRIAAATGCRSRLLPLPDRHSRTTVAGSECVASCPMASVGGHSIFSGSLLTRQSNR